MAPGAQAQTDAELDEYVRNHAETAYHPCGSCRMGSDATSVVDGAGRVHGLENLRVVDASLFPIIPTGNLNAPTIMLAEKMVDKIRGREALPASKADYFVVEPGTPAKQPSKRQIDSVPVND